MSDIQYKVWWVPQIPMKAFEVTVTSPAEGRKICDVLASYDLFQFENRVKPDYSNVGGVSYNHPILTDGEWHDWPDDEDEAAYLLAEVAKL